MGLAMLRLRDQASGIEHLLKAIQANPSSGSQCLRLSLACRRDKHWPDVRSLVSFWQEVTNLDESSYLAQCNSRGQEPLDNKVRVIQRLLVLAEYAEDTQDAPLAKRTYRSLLKQDSQQPAIWNNLAFLLHHDDEQLDEAYELAQRAVRAEPDNSEFRRTLLAVEAKKAANLSTAPNHIQSR